MILIWIKRVLWSLLALVVLLYLLVIGTYHFSNYRYLATLEAGSELVETEQGVIEFSRIGEQGPTILVLHGTPGGYDQGMVIGERLESSGFSILAVSRPGYLRTPGSSGETIDEEVASYLALMDALNIEQVALIGGSGGAPSAFAFAAQYPERVWAVVQLFGLSGSIPDEDSVVYEPSFSEHLIDIFFGETFEYWVLLQIAGLFPEQTLLAEGMGMVNSDTRNRVLEDTGKLEIFKRMMWTSYPLERVNGQNNDVHKFIKLDQSDAASLEIPTLFVHGTDDSNAPYENARFLANSIEEAEFITLEEGDHWIFISRPEDFVPEVIEFLSLNAP